MVDELAFPFVYEDAKLKEWRRQNLKAMQELKETGVEFVNHYTGSTACSPARATIFTGQYPSLHGVSQTSGIAKEKFEPDLFWLSPGTVPTLGNYLQAGGYQTFYKGKWHISAADIFIPATQDPYPSYDNKGIPALEPSEVYLEQERLRTYGFEGWIGPEPHGSDPRDSGASAATGLSGRDVVYSAEAAQLIRDLDAQKTDKPWFLVSSFVNPHDIALFGDISATLSSFNFDIDPTLSFDVPRAPTAGEDLKTNHKPSAQQSYKEQYPKALQPTTDTPQLRKLYYTLQKKVDDEIAKVMDALKASRFKDNTIVFFTSDHGDLLGAHGGLFQKWKVAYEEAIHTPLIIQWPGKFIPHQVTQLTSAVDLVPTILSLAKVDIKKAQSVLRESHSEVRRLVGKDVSPFLKMCVSQLSTVEDILYFMTDDDPFRGLNNTSFLGEPYLPVQPPADLETVIVRIEGDIYKYTRYFDNTQFWSEPGVEDVISLVPEGEPDGSVEVKCLVVTKTVPAKDEFEMYNISKDPLELTNLAVSTDPDVIALKFVLNELLKRQCALKRLTPKSGPVPGLYTCKGSAGMFPRPA